MQREALDNPKPDVFCLTLVPVLRLPFALLQRVKLAWPATKDTSTFQVVRWLARCDQSRAKWVHLTSDIDARQFICDYLREAPSIESEYCDSIVLSTHIVRRLQTNIKLNLIFGWTRLRRTVLHILSNDGFSGAGSFILPFRITLVSWWYNSPDEADRYWSTRQKLQKRVDRIEIFPDTQGTLTSALSGSTIRLSRNFVLATASDLNSHFPSKPQIVFASDITVALRQDATPLLRRIQAHFHSEVDLDGMLWREAENRVKGISPNVPLSFESLMRVAGYEPEACHQVKISDIELDALRLTLHGRERLLFLKAIAQSDVSQYLRVIGNTWRTIPEIAPFVIDVPRFPISPVVTELQKSRVCPDFGSSLGPMPLYFRAQSLAGRAIGLLQRRYPQGNPLLDGLPAHRLFANTEDLLSSCRVMLSQDDFKLREEEERIRYNYSRLVSQDRIALRSLIHTSIRS